MEAPDPPPTPPTVLMSYSHDDRDHKAWVAALATRLRDKGVDVILDQWDLGFGDDVPKFMEKGVRAARYVLMVCTEAYVKKADDGKGGVGYEAMIVTGELVQNLGTNKFIPIIRQKGPDFVLPVCISTRLGVDLSKPEIDEEAFEKLLEQIHEVRKNQKPALGANPFAAASREWEISRTTNAAKAASVDVPVSATDAYHRALEVIEGGNATVWRRYQQAVSASATQSLLNWRNEEITEFKTKADLISKALSGVECFEPYIASILAAAESDKDGYSNQLGWIDQMVNQPGWEGSGIQFHTAFPKLITFVAQALVGAMLVEKGRMEDVHGLLTTPVGRRGYGEELPLFVNIRINGWPDSITECTTAWRLLDQTVEKWTWVAEAFGGKRQARVAISAYYLAMNLLCFVKCAKHGKLSEDEMRLQMPLCFCAWREGIPDDGLKLLLKKRVFLADLLKENGITDAKLKSDWALWRDMNSRWLGNVYRGFGMEVAFPHAKLPEKLERSPLSI